MPGGYNNINGSDGKLYSKDYQPVNRRKSTKFLTELLTKQLKSKKEQDIIIEGIDIVTNRPAKVRVSVVTKEAVIQAWLKQCSKGNMLAIRELLDRVEGKIPQPLVGKDGSSIDLSVTNLPNIPTEDLINYLGAK